MRLIREDLDLHSSTPTAEGEPTWVIHDRFRNKFFQIEWRVFEVLRRWKYGTIDLIVKAVNRETVLNISEQFVEQVDDFLSSHQLLRSDSPNHTKVLVNFHNKNQQAWWLWLIHHYLFFRVPLFKPDNFLNHVLPYIRFMYSKATICIILICLIVGLYLLSKQWDVFSSQLLDFISLEGLLYFALALIISKTAHELGHAFTAKLYGCRVPSMGIAFLVLWPMLYTDTNESWKLGSRRKRLGIAAAGVTVELSIAVLATLAWSLLPPGNLRDMAFIMATTTWVSTLAINWSPFLRFDGYFLLSDWWGIPNLHERSFQIAKWWIREQLFGLNLKPPELMPKNRAASMIIFAFAVWIYRFLLFIGIALLVYHFFTKIIGVILFFIEIGWFIIRPLWIELSHWWSIRHLIRKKRQIFKIVLILGFILIILFIPWRTSITTRAVLQVTSYNTLYLSIPGKVEEILVTPGDQVSKGQLLFSFSNPNLEYRLQQLNNQIAKQKELDQISSFDSYYRQQSSLIAANLARTLTEKKALLKMLSYLKIKAPIDGKITDKFFGAFLGQWLGAGHKLASVKGNKGVKVTGYVSEEDIFRIRKTGSCLFLTTDGPEDSFPCNISNISESAESTLEHPMLASSHGGNISTTSVKNLLIPNDSIYKVNATIPLDDFKLMREKLGLLKLSADSISISERFVKWLAAILIRESGV